MSQINPSGIAGSVAQGALQQGQVARAKDAQRNQTARQSQKAREAAEKELETVEDSFETSDQHLSVDEDADGEQPRQGNSGEGEPEETDPDDPPHHIDVTG